MKNLLIATIILSSALTASAATITCARYGSDTYPISKDAVKLANHLRVTKCDGKRFTTALSLLKLKQNNVEATAEMIAVIEKAKSDKRITRVSKKLKKFSF